MSLNEVVWKLRFDTEFVMYAIVLLNTFHISSNAILLLGAAGKKRIL